MAVVIWWSQAQLAARRSRGGAACARGDVSDQRPGPLPSDGLWPISRPSPAASPATRREATRSEATALNSSGCANHRDIGRAVPAKSHGNTRSVTIFPVMDGESRPPSSQPYRHEPVQANTSRRLRQQRAAEVGYQSFPSVDTMILGRQAIRCMRKVSRVGPKWIRKGPILPVPDALP